LNADYGYFEGCIQVSDRSVGSLNADYGYFEGCIQVSDRSVLSLLNAVESKIYIVRIYVIF
jgi:hypothetical protein